MNLDQGMVNQVINNIPYPVGTAQLIQLAKQFGLNDQITGMLEKLPSKTYNSPQDLQSDLARFGILKP